METNLDKLRKIAKPRSEKAIKRARQRKENREWLRMSQDIAISILGYLRRSNITQKELAEQMEVSPAYIAKLVKGGENLSLKTICRLQEVTGLALIHTEEPYTTKMVLVLPPSNATANVKTLDYDIAVA